MYGKGRRGRRQSHVGKKEKRSGSTTKATNSVHCEMIRFLHDHTNHCRVGGSPAHNNRAMQTSIIAEVWAAGCAAPPARTAPAARAVAAADSKGGGDWGFVP